MEPHSILNLNERVSCFVDFMKPAARIVTEDVINKLYNMNFFTAPAAIKHHGNYTGGLFDHSLAVTETLLLYTEQLELEWDRLESPYLVGMFHDLCKTDDYAMVKQGWEYNKNKTLVGHGDKSVIMLQQLLGQPLTEQEILCIRWHMGAFDEKENWNAYGQAVAEDQNVLYTHTADMYASRVAGV